MGISESTIRRDINELDQMGRLKRVFGGAVSISSDMASRETDVASRAQIQVAEKDKIARYAHCAERNFSSAPLLFPNTPLVRLYGI